MVKKIIDVPFDNVGERIKIEYSNFSGGKTMFSPKISDLPDAPEMYTFEASEKIINAIKVLVRDYKDDVISFMNNYKIFVEEESWHTAPSEIPSVENALAVYYGVGVMEKEAEHYNVFILFNGVDSPIAVTNEEWRFAGETTEPEALFSKRDADKLVDKLQVFKAHKEPVEK